jgi:hypothetical protein
MPGLMGCYVQETGNPVNWVENNQYQQGMCEYQSQKPSAKEGRRQTKPSLPGSTNNRRNTIPFI